MILGRVCRSNLCESAAQACHALDSVRWTVHAAASRRTDSDCLHANVGGHCKANIYKRISMCTTEDLCNCSIHRSILPAAWLVAITDCRGQIHCPLRRAADTP